MKSFLVTLLMAAICFSAHAGGDFKWKTITNPYRNFIYPGQTGLRYNLKYNYGEESKKLRKYLYDNYDVKNSAAIIRMLKDIATGVFFDRYFDVKIKFLKPSDSLFITMKYENGDSVVEKYSQARTLKLIIPLTRFKLQHDFAAGTSKSPSQKGLVSSIDFFVKRVNPNKNYVSILTKLVTEADMPDIISKIKGENILKRK